MFVNNLNPEQQSILLFLAKEIAKADGNLHEIQNRMLDILKEQSQAGVAPTPIATEDLSSFFNDKKSKYSLLLELIGVAQADKEYHITEKNLIVQYASSLGLSNDELITLENWVVKQMDLSEKAELLLNS